MFISTILSVYHTFHVGEKYFNKIFIDDEERYFSEPSIIIGIKNFSHFTSVRVAKEEMLLLLHCAIHIP